MQRRTLSSLLLLAGAGSCTSCSDGADAGGVRPNVLLISVDTLRADHLSTYGYGRETSPRIDALAAEGVLFETVVSSTSWTLAAHAALFTALPDSVHGAFTPEDRLAPDRVTLSERLGDAGYRTAGFYSGPFLHPAFGLDQGFEEWVSCTQADVEHGSAETERLRGLRQRNRRADVAHEDVTSPLLLAGVRDFLERRTREEDGRPFFLFVHMWDPHYNYIPPPPYDTLWDPDYTGDVDGRGLWSFPASTEELAARDLAHLIALYDGEITFTDHHIGLMLDELDARGLREDTLVVLTADHGEEFFEHGSYGHHRTLTDDVVRIPLVLRWPGRLTAGLRVPAQVRIQDVAPTILALAGVPGFEVAWGRDLGELLEGGGASGSDRPAISELYLEEQSALRSPPLKLIRLDAYEPAQSFGFDLERDPLEQGALPDSDPRVPGISAAHAARLQEVRDLATVVGASGEGAEVPAEVLERLRELGYVD